MSRFNTELIQERISQIVNSQAGIPTEIKPVLIERIIRVVEMGFLPEARKEGVTIMTESASHAADRHIERRKGLGGESANMGDPDDAKPKTL